MHPKNSPFSVAISRLEEVEGIPTGVPNLQSIGDYSHMQKAGPQKICSLRWAKVASNRLVELHVKVEGLEFDESTRVNVGFGFKPSVTVMCLM